MELRYKQFKKGFEVIGFVKEKNIEQIQIQAIFNERYSIGLYWWD